VPDDGASLELGDDWTGDVAVVPTASAAGAVLGFLTGFALRLKTIKDDSTMLELISYALTGLGAMLVIVP
jgi:uncharacterized membrane protein (Fun14 family)